MAEMHRLIEMPKNIGYWEPFLNMAKKLKY